MVVIIFITPLLVLKFLKLRHPAANLDDPLDAIPPLITIRRDPHPVFPPTESPLPIHHDKISQPFLPAQIPNAFPIEPFPRALLQTDIPALTLIKPIEEILRTLAGLPNSVVLAQTAAVSMLSIHHLEEILQIHLQRGFLADLALFDALLAAGFALNWGDGIIAGRGGEGVITVVGVGAGDDAPDAVPSLPYRRRAGRWGPTLDRSRDLGVCRGCWRGWGSNSAWACVGCSKGTPTGFFDCLRTDQ